MKFYILIVMLGLLILTGCGKKPKVIKPPIKENNQTVKENNETEIVISNPILPIEEEPKLDMYTWRANDELITQGVAKKIVVVKSKRVMVLLDKDNQILSRHRISLGKNNLGTKLKQGDYKTPEGIYKIIDKRSDKVYYKEMLLDYPSQEDRERSKGLGLSPGGGITIHAQPNWNWDGHGNDYTLSHDWTEGCVAITNEGMNAIWDMIALGTEVEIRE